MISAKKNIRTIRSRQDNELFKITYSLYDPQTISSIELHLGPGQYLHSGQKFGTLYIKNSKQQNQEKIEQNQQAIPLTISIVGKIEKISPSFNHTQNGWRLAQGIKKGSLELFNIRQCQHLISNKSTPESDITGKLNNSTHSDICPNCNKQIWIYYQSEELTINMEYFLNANFQIEQENLKELEWSIILNQQFTPNTTIAKVKDRELNLPLLAKATYLLGEGQKPTNNVIMKIRKVICKHEKIIQNRCQYCLQLIDFSQMEEFTRYLFQLGANGIGKSFAKGSALLRQEQDYISNILDKKKLILILDLDNTILHSTEMSQMELNDLIKIKQFFLLPKLEQTPEGTLKQDFIIIKMRPYLKQFLFVVGKFFEVYVYTKGTRSYADGICRWIRAQWAGQPSPYDINTWNQPHLTFLKNTECFVPYRVISRNQDARLEIKSMQNILPTRTQYHLILDDRRDVWSNSPSWFFTREYIYFYRRNRNQNQLSENIDHFLDNKNENLPYLSKITDCYNHMRHHFPQKSDHKVDIRERPDYFLLFAAYALKKIHTYFFDHLKKSKEQSSKIQGQKQEKKEKASLSYLSQRIKQFLLGKSVRVFLAPGDQSMSTARRLIKLGASIKLKKKESEKPDYVIRGNNYMKFINKWRQDRTKKAKIIQEQKINISVERVGQGEVMKYEVQISQKTVQEFLVLQKIDQIPHHQKDVDESKTRKKYKLDEIILKYINQRQVDYETQLQQLEQLHKQGVPVIAETWILACYEYSYKFKMQDFKIQNPYKQEVQHGHFDEFIAKAAEKLRVQINNHYGNQSSISQEHEKKKSSQIQIQAPRSVNKTHEKDSIEFK